MGSQPLVEDVKLEKTIRALPKEAFTVLDFIEAFKALYPEDWTRLVARFGVFGDKRRYTVTTYLSNRLDTLSHRPDSLLIPLTRFTESKKDYRRTTKQEKTVFGSPWLAVYRKKP